MAAAEEDYDEWVPAIEAAKMVAGRFGGLTQAKVALALGLREGMLAAGAEGSAIAEGEEPEHIETDAPAGELLEIPHERWSQSAIWDSDRLGWDWDIGGFDIATEDSSYAYTFIRQRLVCQHMAVRSSLSNQASGTTQHIKTVSPSFSKLPSMRKVSRGAGLIMGRLIGAASSMPHFRTSCKPLDERALPFHS